MANNKRRPGQSGKGNNEARPDEDKRFNKDEHTGARGKKNPKKRNTNDVGWYTNNTLLYTSAANLSFNAPAGEPISLGNNETSIVSVEKLSLPGVLTIEVEPTVGGDDFQPLMDSIAQDQYSMVRHANSGHSNYEPADLIMYYLSTSGLYQIYSWLVRMYGALMLYNGLNRYTPELLVQSMGGNFTDLIQHISDLRAYIEVFRSRISQFYLPANLPIYQRSLYLYSKVYCDAPLAKSQYIIFVPGKIFKYNQTDGSLTGTNFVVSTSNYTFAQIVTLCESFVSPLLGDEDIGIMSGDVLKCYGQEKCAIPQAMPFDYCIVPEFDLNILGQLENMYLTGPTTSNTVQQISTGTDVFIAATLYKETVNTTYDGKAQIMGPCIEKVLNMHVDIPSAEQVMEASRWMFNAHHQTMTDPATKDRVYIDDCDFFIATRGVYRWYVYNNNVRTIGAFAQSSCIVHSPDTPNLAAVIPFASHPVLISADHASDSSLRLNGIFNDIENYTVVDQSAIHKMNTAAKMGQFRFPLRG